MDASPKELVTARYCPYCAYKTPHDAWLEAHVRRHHPQRQMPGDLAARRRQSAYNAAPCAGTACSAGDRSALQLLLHRGAEG